MSLGEGKKRRNCDLSRTREPNMNYSSINHMYSMERLHTHTHTNSGGWAWQRGCVCVCVLTTNRRKCSTDRADTYNPKVFHNCHVSCMGLPLHGSRISPIFARNHACSFYIARYKTTTAAYYFLLGARSRLSSSTCALCVLYALIWFRTLPFATISYCARYCFHIVRLYAWQAVQIEIIVTWPRMSLVQHHLLCMPMTACFPFKMWKTCVSQ